MPRHWKKNKEISHYYLAVAPPGKAIVHRGQMKFAIWEHTCMPIL